MEAGAAASLRTPTITLSLSNMFPMFAFQGFCDHDKHVRSMTSTNASLKASTHSWKRTPRAFSCSDKLRPKLDLGPLERLRAKRLEFENGDWIGSLLSMWTALSRIGGNFLNSVSILGDTSNGTTDEILSDTTGARQELGH